MKSLIMKWLPAALIAVCLPVAAQTVTTTIHANIPFNFVVGDQYLPAGQYTIVPAFKDSITTWRITSADDHVVASTITRATTSPVASHKRSLLFERVGARYVLTEFWTDEHSGREMPTRKQTLEAASGKTVEVAAN